MNLVLYEDQITSRAGRFKAANMRESTLVLANILIVGVVVPTIAVVIATIATGVSSLLSTLLLQLVTSEQVSSLLHELAGGGILLAA